MELKAYLDVLWRRKWVIVATTLLAFAVAALGTMTMAPEYEATATLRIRTPREGSLDNVAYDPQMADRLANTYFQIVHGGAMRSALIDQVGMTPSAKILVTTPANTEFLLITIIDRDPDLAARAANAAADELIAEVRQQHSQDRDTILGALEARIDQLQDEIRALQANPTAAAGAAGADDPVRTIELKQQAVSALSEEYDRALAGSALDADSVSVAFPAVPSDSPAGPRRTFNLGLGLAVGLVGGTGLALLFERLDPRLFTLDQLAGAAGLPTLAVIPAVAARRRGAGADGGADRLEPFSRLRLRLDRLTADGATTPRTLVLTSARPGEGTTGVAIGLAVAMARAGQRVVVVDANLRSPSVHERLGLPNEVGLVSVLEQRAMLNQAIQPTAIPGLGVLTSGPATASPSELLDSSRLAATITQMANKLDAVLIDAPAVTPGTGALVLSRAADAVVLVAARGSARAGAVRAAVQELADVGATPIGIVVTETNRRRRWRLPRPRADLDSIRARLGSSSGRLRERVRALARRPAPAGAAELAGEGRESPTTARRPHELEHSH